MDLDAPKHSEVIAEENYNPKDIRTSEESQTIWQEIKDNPRVVLYSILANAGSLAFGFDILVTGAVTALPTFSITFGRRAAFALGGIVSAIGTAFAYSSPEPADRTGRRVLFLFSKLVTGFGIGVLMTTCQTYVSDISPVKLRGMLLAIFPFAVSVGQMIAITLVFSRIMILDISSFTIPFAAQWAFSGVAIMCAYIIPESPSMLLSRNKPLEAQKAYLKLHGSGADAGLALSKIQTILDHEKRQQSSTGGATFAECFKGPNCRRTLIIVLVALLQYFLGVSILANANYFLIMAGMSPTQSLQISQIGVGVQIVCIVIAGFTMSFLGRRAVVLWSSVAAGIVFVAMGAAGFYQSNAHALRFVGVAILLVGSISNLGVGAAWPVLISELSSIRLRAKSSAIGFLINATAGVVFSVSTPYMFNADAANLGGKIGFIFAALSFLSFGLCFFFLPETKARSFEELDSLFERGLSARDFKNATFDD